MGLRGFQGSLQVFGEIVREWFRDVLGCSGNVGWFQTGKCLIRAMAVETCRNHGCWHFCAAMGFQVQKEKNTQVQAGKPEDAMQ